MNNLTQAIYNLEKECQKLAGDIWFHYCNLLIKHSYDPDITMQIIDDYLEDYDQNQFIISILEKIDERKIGREIFFYHGTEDYPCVACNDKRKVIKDGKIDCICTEVEDWGNKLAESLSSWFRRVLK